MVTRNPHAVDIKAVMDDPHAVQRAVDRARRAALLDHKRNGRSIVIWENGRVVWVPPDQIMIDDDDSDDAPDHQPPSGE